MDIALQKRLLSACFFEEDTAFKVSKNPLVFEKAEHKIIAEAVKTLCDESITVSIDSVSIEIERKGYTSLVSPEYLFEVATAYNPIQDIDHLLKSLEGDYRKRSLHQKLTNAIADLEKSNKDVNKVWESTRGGVDDLFTVKSEDTPYSISKQILDKSLARFEHFKDTGEVAKLGFEIGIEKLDRFMRGFRKGNLYYLGGLPGDGKTSLMLQAQSHLSTQAPGLVISAEMSNKSLMLRQLSQRVGVKADNLQAGSFQDPNKWSIFQREVESLKNSNVYLYEGDYTYMDIQRSIRQYIRMHKIEWVLVDYVQKLKSGKRNQKKSERIDEASNALMESARDEDIMIFSLAQLRKEVATRTPPVPTSADLADAPAQLFRDAHGIILLYRPEKYDIFEDANGQPYEPGHTDLIIGKNRGGTTGKVSVIFKPETTRFV